MANVLNKPIVGLEAAKAYLSTLTSFYHSLNDLNQYFVARKITFGVNERIPIYFGEAE
jgi:hypothetical protein